MNAVGVTTSAKRGGSELERVMEEWTEYAETMVTKAMVAQDQAERQLCLVNSEYARGRAEGLRQALRILAREE